MTDASEREQIRQEKREQLRQQVGSEPGASQSETSPESTTSAPADPIPVDGSDHLSELVDRYDVVLVDCYADWCGPCQMIEPVVERIAADTEAAVAKVDVDANQAIAAELGVRGVPTLLLYAQGQQVEQLVGVQEESRLRSLIDQHV